MAADLFTVTAMIAALDLIVLIGPAIGVVGIGVSIYLWRRARARPAISYRLTSPPVVNVHRGVEDRISVLYDNERVTDVRLLDLRVENTGNVAITAGAFEAPMSIPLGDTARVLNQPNVGKTVPPELQPHVSVDGQDLVIAPLLLNAGDSFELTVLVSQLSDGNSLKARIAGVLRLIDTGTESSKRRLINATSAAAYLGLSALAGVVGASFSLVVGLDPFGHNGSRVVPTSGAPLCGKVLIKNPTSIFVQLKDTGKLHALPVAQIKSITDDAC